MQNENVKVAPVPVLAFGSLVLAGTAITAAASPFIIVSTVATAIGTFGYWFHELYTQTDLDYFFKCIKINAKDIYPKVKSKKVYDDKTVYIVNLPCGMAVKDVEKVKEAMSNFLRADITLSFDENLIVTAIKNKMKNSYPFELHNFEKPLEIALGYNSTGIIKLDIANAPHLLIAGTTGSGKSVLLRTIITSLILTKSINDIELNLVDFQRVELGIFKNSSYVKEFCTIPLEFGKLLDKLGLESARRLQLFESKNVVNIEMYNKKSRDKLKYIVCIVDEFAALAEKQCKPILDMLKLRTAQDRKCGIHYIICTQRPSVDIINGTIKANIPTRIALKTSSETDSKVIIDSPEAETLKGKGHALLKTSELTEFQAMFLTETQAVEMVKHTFVKKTPVQNKSNMGGVINADTKRQTNNKIY